MPANTPDAPTPSRTAVIGAFLVIYIVWGSTYLGIKVAIETMPPLLMAGTRFLVAGAILFAVCWFRGDRFGGFNPWRDAAIVGTALLAGGNGGVTWAEHTVPSGIAALAIASAPVWFALVDWLRPGGTRPLTRTWIGIGIGFVGVAILAAPAGSVGRVDPRGLAFLLGACLTWAAGSIYSRHTPRAKSPLLAVAAQMLCGGAVLLIASALVGEYRGFDWRAVSTRSLTALIYLISVGSWIGFSTYIWLLKASTPAKVSSYAYVNPIVAVFLGWAVLSETVHARTLWAAAIIIAGVIVLTLPPEAFQPFIGTRRGAKANTGNAAGPPVRPAAPACRRE